MRKDSKLQMDAFLLLRNNGNESLVAVEIA